jgi:immune inhibitor A
MSGLNRTAKKTDHGRRMSLMIFSVLLFLISASIVGAMPPHPDLVGDIIFGKAKIPYFLQHKRELYAAGVNSGGEPILKKSGIVSKTGASGNFNIPTLLVDFSDNTASVSAADFDTLVYIDTNGSVNNFYRENSYNGLSIVSPVFPSTLGWLRAPETYGYYVNNQNGLGAYPQNAQKLVEDLVDLADPFIDFSQFDNDSNGYVDGLIIAHAGPGAEYTGNNSDIWSHKWSITPRLKDGVYILSYSMNPEFWVSPGDITLGVYSHELGHILGLPDLYDTDYTSRGIGYWSIMAGGSWNGPLGSSPSHFDAWSKTFLGFVSPAVPQYDQVGVSFPQVETNPIIYKLWTNGSPGAEYFLVENRQQAGYDAYIPASGLLIWHVDDERSDNDSEWWPGSGLPGHYKVALEQADNLWQMEQDISYGDGGDPYPGTTVNTTFSGSSSPSSDSYSGTGTLVSVVNISNSGAVMTADIAVGSPQEVVDDSDGPLPQRVRSLGNVPNPFNPETIINFEVAAETVVKLEIFGLNGQRIRILADRFFPAGVYGLVWDGRDSMMREVSSGVYFYRLSCPGKTIAQKMLKLR